MPNISKLSVKLDLDDVNYRLKLAADQKKAQGFSKGIDSLKSLAGPLLGPLGGIESKLTGIGEAGAALGPLGAIAAGGIVAIGAGAAAAAFSLHELGKAMDRVSAFVEQSQRLGLSVKTIQRLDLTARLTGTSIETLSRAMLIMGKNIGSGGKSLDARFVQVAKKLATIKDPAKRAAEAMRIFGKSGLEILPLLHDIESLDEARHLIDKFGLSLTDLEAGGAEKLGDEFTKLRFLAEGFWNKAIVAIAPAAIETFTTLFAELEKVGKTMKDIGVTWASVTDAFRIQAGFWKTEIIGMRIAFQGLAGGLGSIGKLLPSGGGLIGGGIGARDAAMGGSIGMPQMPGAHERGSVEAARAIQKTGTGNPIDALPPLLREAVKLLQAVKDNGDPLKADGRGRALVLAEAAI